MAIQPATHARDRDALGENALVRHGGGERKALVRRGRGELKVLVRRVIDEVWNGGNLDLVKQLFSPDYVHHSPLASFAGRAGYQRFVLAYRAAFPGAHFRIDALLADGDEVAVRWTVCVGENTSADSSLQHGGPEVFSAVSMYRCAGGSVAEGWTTRDPLALLQQLGVGLGERRNQPYLRRGRVIWLLKAPAPAPAADVHLGERLV